MYTLEALWRHSENQGVFWGLITRVPLETLWRHSGDTDTLETLCDTLASWTLYISTILSGVSPESLQIFGPLSECHPYNMPCVGANVVGVDMGNGA